MRHSYFVLNFKLTLILKKSFFNHIQQNKHIMYTLKIQVLKRFFSDAIEEAILVP